MRYGFDPRRHASPSQEHEFPPGPHGRDHLFAFGPPQWRPPRERRHHRGGRGRRANVREAILTLLAERPMHGYEMIQEIEQRSRGSWRPSPGSVYPTLQLLEDEGLIVSEATEGTSRKSYRLTEAGQTAQSSGEEQAPWEDFNDEFGDAVRDMKTAVHGIMQAMGEVIRSGSASQRQRAYQVLDNARRELYQVLADRDS